MPDSKTKVEGSPIEQSVGTTEVSARRLKKREIDRKCQRQARERTRSRIAYLESLVENLQHPDGDERSAALMKRLGEVEKERDTLAHTLKGVQKAVFGLEDLGNKGIKTDGTENDTDLLKSVDFGAARLLHKTSLDELSSPASPTFAEADLPPQSSQQARQYSFSAKSDSSKHDVPSQIHNDVCEACRNAGQNGTSKNTWRFANDTLMTNFKRLSPILPEEDLASEDIPVRAVLEGWDSVASQMDIPASWKIMRRIDEQMFSRCGPKERLAVLKTLHLMLQYHRDPTAERRAALPSWYLQRPSQATKPHAYAINFFVWPGVRERFVFEQHKYCGNNFAQPFELSLEIMWPYDFRDCFAQRWDTGRYELSTNFREAISDISKWTMRQDFFQRFPDLRCDIPASQNSPMAVSNATQMRLAYSRNSTSTSMPSMHNSSKQTPISADNVTPVQMTMAENWIPQAAMVNWVDSSSYNQNYMEHTIQANWATG